MDNAKLLELSRPTARELLEETAGEAHQFHTVMTKKRIHRGAIIFTCSCGSSFKVDAIKDNLDALRNVEEEGAK